MPILRSVAAILVALIVTFAISMGTDFILESNGVLPTGHLNVSWRLIAVVLAYRSVYNLLGSFIAAALAPAHRMAHALGLGIFGAVLGTVVTIATWNLDIGPHWYGFTLAALSIPSAWLGGKLAQITVAKRS